MVSTVHPALLLMRESPSQIFCANTLFRDGVIDRVYIEEGSIGEPDGPALARRFWRYGPGGIWQRVRRDLRHFDGHVRTLLDYYVTRLRTADLMDRQTVLETQLLGAAGRRLDQGLRVTRASSVNDPQGRRLIREGGYRLVFVFGTGLLKDELLAMDGVTFVNLHQGWLPRFRGEGIIAALAEEGAGSLGVSVHVIDHGVDTGSILYRERLMIEAGDNAYAIALKATVRGTALFQRVYNDAAQGALRQGTLQVPEEGRCYSSRVLKTRYRMRLAASRALRAASVPAAVPPLWLKRTIAYSCAASGLTVLSRRRHGCRLRILMYHGVLPRVTGPAALGGLFLDEAAFARQMEHLHRAFCVISLDEALTRLQTGQPFPERAVVITLDDGYRNVLTTALPVLRRYRLPAAVFLPSAQVDDRSCSWFDVLRVLVAQCADRRTAVHLAQDLVIDGRFIQHPERTFQTLTLQMTTLPSDQTEPIIARLVEIGQTTRLCEHYPEFALAGWDEWRDAIADGLITVGSHGTTHRNLRQLSSTDRLEDLRRSKHRIEAMFSNTCRAVAYPYGVWDEDVAEAARIAGYAGGLTTDEGLSESGSHPFRLRRTMIGDQGDFALFCARVSGTWGWL